MLVYLALLETREDKTKFERIYMRYRQSMFYAAKRFLHDDDDAEDAVHHAFLRIIENMDKISDVESPKTHGFVVTIVRNLAIDFCRTRGRRVQVPLEEAEPFLADDRPLEQTQPEALHILAALPPEDADILRLRYSQGYEVPEIAQILEISQDAVYKRIQRAKKRLREQLDKGVVEIG